MSLINPNDTIERQNEKLLVIAQSLMRRVEQKNEQSGLAYQQFERAALLETEVRERTHDLERALDLLQESNARLEIANDETEKARSNLTEAIETINEGFALFEADDGLVLSNSRFCRDLIDVEAGLVAGLTFEDYVSLISKSEYLALPADQSPLDWVNQRLSKHREDHVVFNAQLKCDRWLQVSEHRTSRGGTVILQTDVTTIIRRERQERDKMRDKQAEILQATLDHLNQGVCIFDTTLTLVGLNSRMERLLAQTPDQAALGMSFSDLFDLLKDELNFASDFSAFDLKLWANRKTKRDPIVFEVNRGTAQTYNVFAQEMPDRGFVISFTDVTAERAAARTLSDMNELLEKRVQDRTNELGLALAEAERANASKTRFVAAASHDLLQPLSAAKLFVSSLSEQIATTEAQDVLTKTETALNSVEQFITALLDISKLDADKAVFEVQPLALSNILTPLRNELTPAADRKGLDLRVLDCDLTVMSDPGYLRRIVQNLLSNAIRYTDTGRVLVGVRRCGGFARIEVWDTGRGVAQSDQLTIFREFERVSPTKGDMGLGLGLAIVERACEGLGHEFDLWSEPGKGSCFALKVPICTGGAATRNGPLDASPSPRQKLTDTLVVLVENDQDTMASLAQVVESLGPKVIHAKTSDEALTLLREIQLVPDALFIGHPVKSGDDGAVCCQSLRDEIGQIPCAIVSSNLPDYLADADDAVRISSIATPIDRNHVRHFLERL